MIYEITHLNAFAKSLGVNVAKDSGFSIKELKRYIKVSNIKNIIKQYAKKNKYGNLVINDEAAQNICSDIFDWLIGANLAELAAEDVIDCYWDDEQNCMMFKTKENIDG